VAIVAAGLAETNAAWPLTSWQLFSRLRGPTQASCQGNQRVVARVSLGVSPPTTVVVSREPVERC
jgi:hypothetical protein